MHVSLAPEQFTTILGLPINNAFLASVLVSLMLFGIALYAKKTFGLIPTRLQVLFEAIALFILDQLKSAFGSEEKARKFFPLMITLLLFITFANQFSVIPLVSNFMNDGAAVFRTPSSHLSLTLALAITVLGLAHIIAFSISPLGHIGNFIKVKQFLKVRSVGDFGNAFIEFFLGFLDIIGEIAKLISISFRLFGNVFAGEVMIVIISSISIFTSFLVPVPFLILSIFSGFVQAFVFMILSTQFIAGTIGSVTSSEPVKE